jgi:hypothetical protein
MAAIDLVAVVYIPAAIARKSRRAELGLGKEHAWSQSHQLILLAAIERVLLRLYGIEGQAADATICTSLGE